MAQILTRAQQADEVTLAAHKTFKKTKAVLAS